MSMFITDIRSAKNPAATCPGDPNRFKFINIDTTVSMNNINATKSTCRLYLISMLQSPYVGLSKRCMYNFAKLKL